MMFKVGDIIINPRKRDWGIGIVKEIEKIEHPYESACGIYYAVYWTKMEAVYYFRENHKMYYEKLNG